MVSLILKPRLTCVIYYKRFSDPIRERQIKCMRRRKLPLGGNGVENVSAKSKLGNEGFHGNKRYLSILTMHINATGELHTYRTGGTGLHTCPILRHNEIHGTSQ